MVPFYGLISAFVMCSVIGWLGVPYFADWQHSIATASAVMLLIAASAHWGSRRQDLINMVPQAFPKPELIVSLTGILEIVGAIGLQIPAVSRVASICLALLLIAMFPANVKAARERMSIGGRPVPGLLPRTILQIVFIAAVLLAG